MQASSLLFPCVQLWPMLCFRVGLWSPSCPRLLLVCCGLSWYGVGERTPTKDPQWPTWLPSCGGMSPAARAHIFVGWCNTPTVWYVAAGMSADCEHGGRRCTVWTPGFPAHTGRSHISTECCVAHTKHRGAGDVRQKQSSISVSCAAWLQSLAHRQPPAQRVRQGEEFRSEILCCAQGVRQVATSRCRRPR